MLWRRGTIANVQTLKWIKFWPQITCFSSHVFFERWGPRGPKKLYRFRSNMRKAIQVENETQWKIQNTEEHVAKKETFPRIPQVDKKWQSMEMVVTGREREATSCIVQYVYVLWVGGHILVSDWQNSRQSYLSTQTSQSKISVREELQNNETERK